MHVMMVEILLQVLDDTLWATRGISTVRTKHRGRPTIELKASKSNLPKLRDQHQCVLWAQKDQGIDKFCCTTQSREQHGIHHA